MNIHTNHFRLAVSLYHTQILPAVPFIKRSMIGNKIENGNSSALHIFAGIVQKPAGDSLAAVFRFHIQGAEIRSQVLSVMKIIFNDACSGDNLLSIQNGVSLGDRLFPAETLLHAFKIGFLRDAPFPVKPVRKPVL